MNQSGFRFEKLIMWQKAMEMGEEIFRLSEQFPKHDLYGLTSRIRRAADSVALNIAEVSILQSGPEFKRFPGYSIRYVAEVVTAWYKA